MSGRGTTMERREFMKLLGSGIYILFSTGPLLRGQQGGFQYGRYPEDFNAYLRIAEDGKVTCYTGKIEMGQGIITSLAQMLAEELEVPFSSVGMVMGDTKLCPWDGGTNGSRTIKYFGPVLRAAGAEAREVLIRLAAEHLGLPQDRLIAAEGEIRDNNDASRKVSYGILAKGRTIERHLENKPALKSPDNFRICGQSSPRTDAREKVTGSAKFSGDIRLPGMLYGKVLRLPAHGARPVKIDTAAAGGIKDVKILQDGDFIGVVHPLPDMAEKAVGLIKAEYEIPDPTVDDSTIHELILNTEARDNEVERKGELGQGRNIAARDYEAAYFTPYVAHAPTETHSALADVKRDGATVWVGTQRPFGADAQIGRAVGLDADSVRIITPYVGGGFGGKSQVGQAVQAARLSKMAGAPVQVVWTREEEFFYDTFMPAAAVKIHSGLDASNRIAFWDYHVFFAGNRSSECIYDVPHVRTVSRGSGFGGDGPHPFDTGAWRGPGSNTNIFARESHIDVMAADAGVDPLEFRFRNLADARMIRVVRAAADRFGWERGKAPTGRGCGMVCLDYLGTYVAAMAKVRVDSKSGRVEVERIVHAQDMGPVINPEGARMQIEGAIIMGLGYSLSEEIHFKGGEIRDLGFGSYKIPRFSWAPQKIETVLVENHAIDPSGCGEPPIVGMGALIANAVFDATGIRMNRLPITPERLKSRLG
ncbi:MAG: xanthine dehydrogenase family protein molybdopterin-binding subunit [Acidobacteria bacterium]|nr:xanthine dehydrogenase family protein molybdopterin-binding subunit [Acidobacteriota bacterium]